MIDNAFVQQVKTIAITADELWSFIQNNKNIVCLGNLRWVIAGLALSQATDSGLVLAARVAKHADELPIGVGNQYGRENRLSALGYRCWGGYDACYHRKFNIG